MKQLEQWVIGVDPGATTGISVHSNGERRPIWCGPMRDPDWRKVVRFLEQGLVPSRGRDRSVVEWPQDWGTTERLLVVEDQHVGPFKNAVIPLVARRVTWEVLAAERGWAVARTPSGVWRRAAIGQYAKGLTTDEFKRLAIQTVKMEMGLDLTHDVAEAVCMGIFGVTLPVWEAYLVEPGKIQQMGRSGSRVPKKRSRRG